MYSANESLKPSGLTMGLLPPWARLGSSLGSPWGLGVCSTGITMGPLPPWVVGTGLRAPERILHHVSISF